MSIIVEKKPRSNLVPIIVDESFIVFERTRVVDIMTMAVSLIVTAAFMLR